MAVTKDRFSRPVPAERNPNDLPICNGHRSAFAMMIDRQLSRRRKGSSLTTALAHGRDALEFAGVENRKRPIADLDQPAPTKLGQNLADVDRRQSGSVR